MGTSRAPSSVDWSDVTGRLLTLRAGIYRFDSLARAMTAALGCDGAELLDRAAAAGYVTVLTAHTLDSDGEVVDDALVRVDPGTILADGVPLPTGPAFDAEPLCSELVIPLGWWE